MPLSALRNITIEHGTDWSEHFSLEIDGVPVDLTGYSLVGQCRRNEEITSDLVFAFTFVIDESDVTVSVAAATTEALDLSEEPDAVQYWYDYMLISPSGSIEKIQRGRLTLQRTLTVIP